MVGSIYKLIVIKNGRQPNICYVRFGSPIIVYSHIPYRLLCTIEALVIRFSLGTSCVKTGN